MRFHKRFFLLLLYSDCNVISSSKPKPRREKSFCFNLWKKKLLSKSRREIMGGLLGCFLSHTERSARIAIADCFFCCSPLWSSKKTDLLGKIAKHHNFRGSGKKSFGGERNQLIKADGVCIISRRHIHDCDVFLSFSEKQRVKQQTLMCFLLLPTSPGNLSQ